MKERKTITDTDGNTYTDEGEFLAHACEKVSCHLRKFGSMDWWDWRQELCWWDLEMDERLRAGDISEETHEKFVDCLYGGLNELNTHIW